VVAGRLTEQLDGILAQGRALGTALGKIDLHDDGDRGTGSRLFNAALDYYGSWVDGDRPGAPALLAALRAERARYLQTLPGLPAEGRTIDPWGGASQPLGGVSLAGLPEFKALPDAAFAPAIMLDDTSPAPALVTSLPAPILTALRLGLGRAGINWSASFDGTVARGQTGTLHVTFFFAYYAPDGSVYGLDDVEATIAGARNCVGDGELRDAADVVRASWNGVLGCPDVPAAVQAAAQNRSTHVYSQRAEGFVTSLVENKLHDLQAGFYADLLAGGGQLTHGTSDATDVAAAAQRLGGAEKLVDSYVTLGLPQALATDDALHGLIAGDAANALAHPFFDDRTADPAATVPGQVASFFRLVQAEMPQTDPLTTLGILLNRHRQALQDAIAPYIKVQHGAVDMGALDEGSPLVQSTLDRLALTRAVLDDQLAHPPAAPQPPAAQPQPQPTATVTPAPTPRPTAAARARLIHRVRVQGRTIRLTVGCQSGTCRLTVTAASGRRSVTRTVRLTLRAGAHRTVALRLNAAGRRLLARRGRLGVTVEVAQAGRARPLSVARVTVR
jgi:hypothetical protein